MSGWRRCRHETPVAATTSRGRGTHCGSTGLGRSQSVRSGPVGVGVSVLGQFEVVVDGTPVRIPGAKERALLAVLALERGRTVSAERLASLLWPASPSGAGTASLRILVSRIRKVLAADVITTVRPGYRLDAQAQVDASDLEHLVADGRAALARGEAEDAAERFTAALALWRGDAVTEAVADILPAEAAHLLELKVQAIEGRVEAELALGHHAELVGELARLTAEHPFRERLWAVRLVALYRSGRQAEALAAYQELRRRLADELGLTPSPELQTLERRLLEQSPDLEGPAPLDPAVATSWARHDALVSTVAGVSGVDGASGAARRRLGRARSEPAQPPLSVELTEAPSAGLHGRVVERHVIADRRKRAENGERQLVLLAGEPGIGKTALVAEVAREAWRDGATVAYGSCAEGLGSPYALWVDALDPLVRGHADELGATLGRARMAELARLLPSLGELAPSAPEPRDAEGARHLLFGAVADTLRVLSRDALLVVALDDLHWADQPSQLLLRHLVHATTDLGLLVIGTYRHTELHRGHSLGDLLADFRRERNVTRIALAGLSADEIAAVVESAAGHALTSTELELARVVHRETAGNPFFAWEVLMHLAESGAIEIAEDGRWVVAQPEAAATLPESVLEVVGRRVGNLGPFVESVLAMAAVIGCEFDLALLTEAVELDEDTVVDYLERAEVAGIVTTLAPGRFAFVHALVVHALTSAQSATRLALAHRRIAELVEAARPGRSTASSTQPARREPAGAGPLAPRPRKRSAIVPQPAKGTLRTRAIALGGGADWRHGWEEPHASMDRARGRRRPGPGRGGHRSLPGWSSRRCLDRQPHLADHRRCQRAEPGLQHHVIGPDQGHRRGALRRGGLHRGHGRRGVPPRQPDQRRAG